MDKFRKLVEFNIFYFLISRKDAQMIKEVDDSVLYNSLMDIDTSLLVDGATIDGNDNTLWKLPKQPELIVYIANLIENVYCDEDLNFLVKGFKYYTRRESIDIIDGFCKKIKKVSMNIRNGITTFPATKEGYLKFNICITFSNFLKIINYNSENSNPNDILDILNQGIDPNDLYYIKYPILFYLIEKKSPKILLSMIKKGLDIKILNPITGKLPIYSAVNSSVYETVVYILKYGAPLSQYIINNLASLNTTIKIKSLLKKYKPTLLTMDYPMNEIQIKERVIKEVYPEFSKKYIDSVSNSSPTLWLSDIKNKMKYKSNASNIKTSFHHGQRKLFLTELYYLSLFSDKNKPVQYCVYVGAAPGNHIIDFSKLFPNIKFILFDGRPFNFAPPNARNKEINAYNQKAKKVATKLPYLDVNVIKSSDKKIFFIQELFYDKDASAIGDNFKECLFISDIRTKLFNTKHPTDIDTIYNNAQQLKWIQVIQPSSGILKFKTPYGGNVEKSVWKREKKRNSDTWKEINKTLTWCKQECNIDFESDYIENDSLVYCGGKVMLQPWAPHSSSETRFVFTKRDLIERQEFKITDYEDKLFYYNMIDRCLIKKNTKYTDVENCFDLCNDCAFEEIIWESYNKCMGKESDKSTIISQRLSLCRSLNKYMCNDNHGFLI